MAASFYCSETGLIEKCAPQLCHCPSSWRDWRDFLNRQQWICPTIACLSGSPLYQYTSSTIIPSKHATHVKITPLPHKTEHNQALDTKSSQLKLNTISRPQLTGPPPILTPPCQHAFDLFRTVVHTHWLLFRRYNINFRCEPKFLYHQRLSPFVHLLAHSVRHVAMPAIYWPAILRLARTCFYCTVLWANCIKSHPINKTYGFTSNSPLFMLLPCNCIKTWNVTSKPHQPLVLDPNYNTDLQYLRNFMKQSSGPNFSRSFYHFLSILITSPSPKRPTTLLQLLTESLRLRMRNDHSVLHESPPRVCDAIETSMESWCMVRICIGM